MIIKTLLWNIGGGKVRKADSPLDHEYYAEDGLESIINTISKYNVDFITLQETHADSATVQAKIIAEKIGLPYFINDIYDKSHLEQDQGLGQAIISRFPIKNHDFNFFFNPHFQLIRPNNEVWISHDKGLSKCLIEIEQGKEIQVETLHLIPFRKFGVDPLDKKQEDLRNSISKLTSPTNDTFLLQGDFNYDETSLRNFLPDLLNQNISEVLLDTPTTPRGRKYDHILFRNLKHISSEVIKDVLTDHFPVYSEFEM